MKLRDVFQVFLSLRVLFLPPVDVIDRFLGAKSLKHLEVLIANLSALPLPRIIVQASVVG